MSGNKFATYWYTQKQWWYLKDGEFHIKEDAPDNVKDSFKLWQNIAE